MIISLTGFMGSGKTTAGREILKLLPEASLIDLDDWIEENSGRSIPEIFSSEGEAAFRDMEHQALREIIGASEGKTIILSLGGGTLTKPENAEIVKNSTLCFYLNASTDTLAANLLLEDPGKRPMMNGASGEKEVRRRISELMEKRESMYEGAARHIIDIDGRDYADIAEEILSKARRTEGIK